MSKIRTNTTFSAHSAADVTPNDSTEVKFRGLYVGTGGDVTVDMLEGGTDITFSNVPDGSFLPIAVRKVKVATTASNIIGLG